MLQQPYAVSSPQGVFTPDNLPLRVWQCPPAAKTIKTRDGVIQANATVYVGARSPETQAQIGVLIQAGDLVIGHCPVYRRNILDAYRAMEIVARLAVIEPFSLGHAYLAVSGTNGKIKEAVITAIGMDQFVTIAQMTAPELELAEQALKKFGIEPYLSPHGAPIRPH